jgi:hypothetical protein
MKTLYFGKKENPVLKILSGLPINAGKSAAAQMDLPKLIGRRQKRYSEREVQQVKIHKVTAANRAMKGQDCSRFGIRRSCAPA